VLLTLRILLWRGRRLLVFGCLVAAACVVARQAVPPAEPLREVVVAAHDLTAGDELTADDLRVTSVPAHLVPSGTPRADELPGRRVTASVPAGLPLVAGLVGAVLSDGALVDDARFGLPPPPGTVTVPVRLVDPAVARILRPGDRVDLVAPHGGDGADPSGGGAGGGTGAGPGVLARAALVLEVVTEQPAGSGGDGLAAWTGQGVAVDEPLVVVAVAPDEGHLLAAAGWGSLGAVVVEGS